MVGHTILPPGQHRLDPSPDFDPILWLLRRLWVDLFWVGEHSASLAADWIEAPEDVKHELHYLREDADDALQGLARLIELLLAGQAIDRTKRIPRGNSLPYFRDGVATAEHAVTLGQHSLDPPPDMDPVRYFLEQGKNHLLRV